MAAGDDTVVLGLNEHALRRLNCVKKRAIVLGAAHLLEKPGTLDGVRSAWFDRHCRAGISGIRQPWQERSRE